MGDDGRRHKKAATKANSQGKGQTKKAKKKKSLKDEFQMDIKDMIVKKRLASLNASAIMSASYAQERPKDAQDSHALVPYSASEAAISLAASTASAASTPPKKKTPEKKSQTP